MKRMDRNKVTIITCILVCIACISFYLITKKEENKKIQSEELTEELDEEMDELPESDFDLESIEVTYENAVFEIDMRGVFEKEEQSNYFKYELYNYLYEYGYKKIMKFEVQGGSREQSTGQIYFQVKVITKQEEEFIINCWYNDNSYSYYFAFAEEEMSSGIVEIKDMDNELEQIIGSELENMERQFGKYLYNEKTDATEARVTNYEMNGTTVEIQVELNDEYMTYCKIYYDTENHLISFKIWG